MGFVDDLFKKQKEDRRSKIHVEKDFEKNLNAIKEILENCDDVIYRDFNVGQDQKLRFATIYAEGLADKNLVNQHILKNLMLLARVADLDVTNLRNKIYEVIVDGTVAVTDIKEIDDMNIAVDFILSGETVLILDQWDKALMIASKGWPMRSVVEPSTETVIRGPAEGFTETLRVNTALVRRRIRDPKFKIKQIQVGRRSKTDVAILFIEETVNKAVLQMVKERLDKIDIDAILESGYVEQLIEDNWRSPFPQIQNTQRPDTMAAGLYEGRIGLIIDNTPFALIVPSTAVSMLQSPEDYYERFFIGSAVRILRFMSMIIALTFPALYIAVTSFHPGMLPTDLALYVAGSRMNVPFPAFIEAFIMEGALELLREAGIRLPTPIGSTIGIVGGLVLGQAAVQAGIVSPLMVIIVALTAMATYSSPSYSLASSFRMLRFILMALAGVFGLYGVIIGLFLLLAHLCSLKSFGVPYLSPFVASNTTLRDFKDAFIRAPLHMMKNRPEFLHRSDSDRLSKMTAKIFSWEGKRNESE